MGKKVIVGMSGGVDSSAAAYILKEQGYDVIGVTMQMYQNEDVFIDPADSGCGSFSSVEDAKNVANTIGIPHYVVGFESNFKENVIDYFVSEYERGYTPNPCNQCNRHVKFAALLRKAEEFGADYIATGHYARVNKMDNGRYTICNSATASKDQTYALYNLTQEQLSKMLMPVGDYEKAKIREIAAKAGLSVASKGDSQDICFIPNHDYAGFIEKYTGKRYTPGNFVDLEGKVLGQHKGIIHYTIGQRKGLGITAPTPLFVKELNMDTNEVVICQNEDLFSNICYVGKVNYMSEASIEAGRRAVGKIRYSHSGAACTLEPVEGGLIKCTFDEPQRAMTPGQAAVFYDGENVLCGGTIEKM